MLKRVYTPIKHRFIKIKARIRFLREQIITPLSARERTIYSALLIGLISLIIVPRISATVSDEGSLFSVAATKCDSSDDWLYTQNITGQPTIKSNDRLEITSENSAIWAGNEGFIRCAGYTPIEDHTKINNSVEITFKAIDDTIDEHLLSGQQSEVAVLTDGTVLSERIETRSPQIQPNMIDTGEGAENKIDEWIVEIEISTDGEESWLPFHRFDESLKSSLDATHSIALPNDIAIEADTLSFKVNVRSNNNQTMVFIDSIVWVYEVGANSKISARLIDSNTNIELEQDIPLISQLDDVNLEIDIKDPNDGIWQGLGNRTLSLFNEDSAPEIQLNATLVSQSGETIATQTLSPEYVGKGTDNADNWRAPLDLMPQSADPGKYSLEIQAISDNGAVQTVTQDFLWGVIAMNTDFDTYNSGDKAQIDMTILDERGATVCDANLTLTITGPNTNSTLSTENGEISISEKCEIYGPHIEPDYETEFIFDQIGTYNLSLAAETDNGTYEISHNVSVNDSNSISISRQGPTRIFPVSSYDMHIAIHSDTDLSGTTITEKVPASFAITQSDFALDYSKVEEQDGIKTITWNIEDGSKSPLVIGYNFDAPDISPEFYLLGNISIENPDSSSLYNEKRQWQIAGDALDVFRVTNYEIETGEFSGTTYTLSLNDDLSSNYFAMINGMSNNAATRGPGEDFARVSGDPHSNFVTVTAANEIELTRGVGTNQWIGSVTIVECLESCDTLGFELNEVLETNLAAGSANALQSTNDVLAANYTSSTVPFGGVNGGGLSTSSTTADEYGVIGGIKISKVNGDEIQFDRYGAENRVPQAATVTSYITEWSGAWNVQDVNVTGTNSGNGVDDVSEYSNAAISTVTRDNSFVWGAGYASNDGIGDGAFGQVITLGDGVNQNTTESLVSVGSEGSQLLSGRNFQVYVLENSNLAVDYRFKVDGDAGSASGYQELNITVDPVLTSEIYENAASSVRYTEGQRLPIFYSSVNGNGQAYSRPVWAYRHTSSTNILYWRGYSGQAVTGWFQSVDFSQIVIEQIEINQLDYRWRDDTADLNTDSGYLAAENTPITSQDKGDELRLRIQVANTSVDDDSLFRSFELQFAALGAYNNCTEPVSWVGISDEPDDAFTLFDTSHISPDGEATTSGLLSNTELYTFVNGEGRDSADNTSNLGPYNAGEYTELEYAIKITNEALTGEDYCFRLYDTANNTELNNYINIPQMTISSTPISLPSGLGEAGTFSSAINGGWTTINFIGSYTTPVVVGTTNSHNGQAALVFESRNVTSTSADMRVCESEGATVNGCDTHASETVGYVVIDATKAATTPGIEAGTQSISGGESSAIDITYPSPFSSNPYVFSNLNTVNDTQQPTEVVIRNVTSTSFNVNICEHLQGNNDNCDTGHATETIGWVAIDPLNSPFGEQHQLGQVVSSGSGAWATASFSPSFASAPVVVAASQTDTGGQDVEIDEARLVSTTSVDIRSCEIDTLDTCDSHNPDDVAYLAIEPGVMSFDNSLDQDTYRFYENTDDSTPVTAIGDENYGISGIDDGDIVRLRIALQTGDSDVIASTAAWKLQFAEASDCSAAGSWIDVGAPGSGSIWRGFDNPTPSDESTLASSLLNGGSNSLQSYEESNNSIENPNLIPGGSRGEWDWVVQNNGATNNTSYCFRMVGPTGDLINYSQYPQLVTATGTKLLIMFDGAVESVDDDFEPSIDGTQWLSTIGGSVTTDCTAIASNAFQIEATSGVRELESVDINTSSGGSINFILYAPSAADETATCEQPEAADDLTLQYATDGSGSSWTTIATYDGGDYETPTLVAETIPVAAQTATTRFRFFQPNYSAGDFDHWAIDDILIVSQPIPSGWSCISCNPGDPYYQNFIRGEATYGGTGGSESHSHTATGSAGANSDSSGETFFGSQISDTGHAHSVSGISISTESNLPQYNGLSILESDVSAESVSTLPQDSIIIFDGTIPAGFSAFNDINGSFVRGDTGSNNSGGSNTHTHSVTASLDTATGGTQGVDITPINVQNDDFDPNIDATQWNDTTGMSAATFCAATSGNALHSSGGTDDVAETIDVDVSNGGDITFDLFIAPTNSGSCNAAEAGEDVILEYSTNGGANWTQIALYDEADYPTMTPITETIPAGAISANTRFRFTQVTNSGNNFDHWVIDDLNILANPGGTTASADAGHTHSVSGTMPSEDNQPPFIEVTLGKANSDISLPGSMIGMFSGVNPTNWYCLSCGSGDAFYQRFFKASSTYGATGGDIEHSPSDFIIESNTASSVSLGQPGTTTSDDAHTHNVTFSSVSTENNLPPYINTVFASLNSAPDVPTNLDQQTTGATQILTGEWTNEGAVMFIADATDDNNPENLRLCVEVKEIGTPFTGTDTNCGSPTAYSGSPLSVSVNVVGLSDGTDYHWQARIRDEVNDTSSWVSFGGNLETEADFRIDTSSPTGSVYDGPTSGVDLDYNNGSLDELEANWIIDSNASGLAEYEVSVGTTPASTDVSSWVSVGTSTSTTISGLNLNTSQPYYVNVRTTDNANNTSILSSDGIFVAPTLSFNIDTSLLDFGNVNSGNSFTVSEDVTLTTSTNAYNGYVIRGFATGLLTNGSETINMFDGGTYASPDEWLSGDTGYGYTSSDTLVQGINKFNNSPCPGGGTPPCFAPWSLSAPGDIVADHTGNVSGTPIISEDFVITHRVTALGSQVEGNYSTVIIYNITAIY